MLIPIDDNVRRHGWRKTDSHSILASVLKALSHGNIEDALNSTKSIIFQMMPSLERIQIWQDESDAIYNEARAIGGTGITATANFGGIISDSTSLALPCLSVEAADIVQLDSDLSDRWFNLIHQLTEPDNIAHWVLWAIYWASFRSSQDFVKDNADTDFNEESCTGEFLKTIRNEAKLWAGPRIDQMGYPTVKSIFGTLGLGSTKGESRTGADFGIIIDINVGGLVVRKVALLQSKVSYNGCANIGSNRTGPQDLTQLEKLSDPERDFYVFYHRRVRQSSCPGPTVSRVRDLIFDCTDRAAQKVEVRTRDYGFDWSCFIAFGMCNPSSGIGKSLLPGEDALSVLSSNYRDVLPSKLLIVTAGGGDYSYALEQQIKDYYAEHGTSYPDGRVDASFDPDDEDSPSSNWSPPSMS